MKRECMIQKNMMSQDEFVKNLYIDLNERIKDYEKGEADVNQMKSFDAVPEIVITGAFSIFLLTVIF